MERHLERSFANAGTPLFVPAPVGNYYFLPFESHSLAFGFYLFDSVARKFMTFDPTVSQLVSCPNALPGAIFDLNNINKRLLYMEQQNVTGNTSYSFYKNIINDSLFAFTINLGSAIPIARYDGLNAPGLATAKLFALSASAPLLYYVNRNQIFRLDILAKTAVPIYTFPGGTEIRDMKMYFNNRYSNDVNHGKMLVVATKESNDNKVYYFPLDPTGIFVGNTYSQVFGGFNQINSITLKFPI